MQILKEQKFFTRGEIEIDESLPDKKMVVTEDNKIKVNSNTAKKIQDEQIKETNQRPDQGNQ